MKNYPLEIEICHTDNELIYRSKGHHNTEEFSQALREFGVQGKWSIPEKIYVKTVPAPVNSDYNCFYKIVDKNVRGCYPATYVYEYYGFESEFLEIKNERICVI